MAKQILNDGETGLVLRNKINENNTELYTHADSAHAPSDAVSAGAAGDAHALVAHAKVTPFIECSSQEEEDAAIAAGHLIIVRMDILDPGATTTTTTTAAPTTTTTTTAAPTTTTTTTAAPTTTTTTAAPTTTTTTAAPGGFGPEVSLMLHMDGDTFVDSSSYGHAVTVLGTTVADTAVKHFGAASFKGTGTAGNGLQIADHASLQFGTGDFCIDYWAKKEVSYDASTWFEKGDYAGGAGYSMYGGTTSMQWYINNGALSIGNTSYKGESLFDHFEFSRTAGVIYLFKNGVIYPTTPAFTGNMDAIGDLFIGCNTALGSTLTLANIDEFRMQKGTYGHTADFAVPTSQYTGA